MKTRLTSRVERMPLRRRLMVLGLLACTVQAPAMAKASKPAKTAATPVHHHHHHHHSARHGHAGTAHHRHPKPAASLALAGAEAAVADRYRATGKASWYGKDFHGRRTANGESFDRHEFTGAHRTLPFGTVVRVTNLRNGRSALVRINDRGPFTGNRIIDLSYAAAKQIGMTGRGVARVRIEEVAPSKLAKDDHARKAKS